MWWNLVGFVLLELFSGGLAEYCRGYGHSCPSPQRCCSATCCIPSNYEDAYHSFRWSVWNMWYFWFIVIFILMSCFGGCGYWRRRQLLLAQGSGPSPSPLSTWAGFGFGSRQPRVNGYGPSVTVPQNSASYPTNYDSAYSAPTPVSPGGGYPQGAFPAPPPYTEVVTKPGMYPPKKDELPPYPGDPYYTTPPAGNLSPQVPSLPPYSPPPPTYSPEGSSNHNAANSNSANQDAGHYNLNSGQNVSNPIGGSAV